MKEREYKQKNRPNDVQELKTTTEMKKLVDGHNS